MNISLGLFAIKHWKTLILILTLTLCLIFFLFFGLPQQDQVEFGGIGGTAAVSPLVMRYEPLVRQYAEKYGVGGYIPLLLAKMMQESGGRIPDVMQSSESLGLPRNTITDPEYSIDVGIQYFAKVLKNAKGDVKLALQSYNFGEGFIPYALARGGYSKETAIAFSNMMAARNGWSRYGDINYVDNVLRYVNGFSSGSVGPVNSYGFVKPINPSMAITSGFGLRIHPITGIAKPHEGIDFSCGKQAIPIYAAKSGVVTKSGWQNPSNHKAGYGQRIYINHGGNVETIYAHLSKLLVSEGQSVTQGQQIGTCGTTGSSTGMHLHFELSINGSKVDPSGYVN